MKLNESWIISKTMKETGRTSSNGRDTKTKRTPGRKARTYQAIRYKGFGKIPNRPKLVQLLLHGAGLDPKEE
jgi:hypothetical protein